MLIGRRDGLGRYMVEFVEDKIVRPVPPAGVVPLSAVTIDKEVNEGWETPMCGVWMVEFGGLWQKKRTGGAGIEGCDETLDRWATKIVTFYWFNYVSILNTSRSHIEKCSENAPLW